MIDLELDDELFTDIEHVEIGEGEAGSGDEAADAPSQSAWSEADAPSKARAASADALRAGPPLPLPPPSHNTPAHTRLFLCLLCLRQEAELL